ncbi:hypothetical protein ACLOJK_000203 [Asimina triloba]
MQVVSGDNEASPSAMKGQVAFSFHGAGGCREGLPEPHDDGALLLAIFRWICVIVVSFFISGELHCCSATVNNAD